MSIDAPARGLAAASLKAVAPLTARSRQVPRIALLGDSRQNFSHAVNSISSSLGTQYDVRAGGLAAWLTALTGGRVSFPLTMNFGVSSSKSDDLTQTQIQNYPAGGGVGLDSIFPAILAAYPTLTTVQAAIASGANGAIIFTSTNDRTNSYTVAQSLANITAARDQLLAAGLFVIIICETPRGDSSNTGKRLTAPDLGHHFQVAEGIRRLKTANCFIADLWPYMANPTSTTGDAILGMTGDGLHPSPTGAFYAATQIAPIITTLFPAFNRLPASNTDIWSADNVLGNLVANPMLTSTGGTKTATTGTITDAATAGNITGGLAASWELSLSNCTGVTATVGKVAATDTTPELQQIVITGTPSSSSPTLSLRQKINGSTNAAAFAGLAAGDQIQECARVDVIGAQTGLLGAYANFEVRDSTPTIVLQARGMAYTTSNMPNIAAGYGGVQVTEPLTLPPGLLAAITGLVVTELRTGYEIRLVQSVACSITLQLWPVSTRKI